MAKLSYLDNYIEIINFNYSPDGEQYGNLYNTTFDINVKSNGFFGYGVRLEVELNQFTDFVNQLIEINNHNRDFAKLDICFGGGITFSLNSSDYINVSGTVYGNNDSQSLNYLFTVNQTALSSFVNELKIFLENV